MTVPAARAFNFFITFQGNSELPFSHLCRIPLLKKPPGTISKAEEKRAKSESSLWQPHGLGHFSWAGQYSRPSFSSIPLNVPFRFKPLSDAIAMNIPVRFEALNRGVTRTAPTLQPSSVAAATSADAPDDSLQPTAAALPACDDTALGHDEFADDSCVAAAHAPSPVQCGEADTHECMGADASCFESSGTAHDPQSSTVNDPHLLSADMLGNGYDDCVVDAADALPDDVPAESFTLRAGNDHSVPIVACLTGGLVTAKHRTEAFVLPPHTSVAVIVTHSDARFVGGARSASLKLPSLKHPSVRVLHCRVLPTGTKPLATTWAATLVAKLRALAAMVRPAIPSKR